MDLAFKDYVTFALSGGALLLSFYNFYRSRYDIKTAAIRAIAEKKSECETVAWEVTTIHRRNEKELSALRFDARREQVAGVSVGDSGEQIAKVIEFADSSISKQQGAIDGIKEILTEMSQDTTVTGSHAEMLALERILGQLKTMRANALDEEAQISGVIADARRLLIAAVLPSKQ